MKKKIFTMDKGFFLKETEEISIIGVETCLYVHNKTLGKVFHVKNNDKEKAFVVSFETPAINEKGIPHALEHIITAGNSKYPVSGGLSALMRQSYYTAMGAHVNSFYGITNYYYATHSETQLLKFLDYYMHAVFYPLIYDDKFFFMQEVWHYELENIDSPLEKTGIIYNEQKGAYTIETAALYNNLQALYPESVIGNVSGGIPEHILNLTVEEVIEYHKQYYHPGNATIYMYGNIKIDPFLRIIGSFFDDFDKRIFFIDKGKRYTMNISAEQIFHYPAEANTSILYYSINLGMQPFELYGVFDILGKIITSSNSPFMRKLAILEDKVNSGLLSTTAGESIFFSIVNAKEEDAKLFQESIDAIFDGIIKNGFDTELIEAVISNIEFKLLSITDQSDFGLNLLMEMAGKHSAGDGFYYLNAFKNTLDIVKKEYKKGFFERLFRQYILKNPHRAISLTIADPNMRRELDTTLYEKLCKIKKEMKHEEIVDILNKKAIYIKSESQELSDFMMKELNPINVDRLPVGIDSLDIIDEQFGEIRLLITETPNIDISATNIKYNASEVTIEELHFLNLFASLLGEVKTKNYESSSLQTKTARYLRNFRCSVDAYFCYNKESAPVLSISWNSLNDDYEKAVALVQEIILQTDISDLVAIANIAMSQRNKMRSEINFNPISVQLSRALANQHKSLRINAYMKGIEYYTFLRNVPEMIKNAPSVFIAKLDTVRGKISSAVDSVMFAGSAKGIEIFKENIKWLRGYINNHPIADYSPIMQAGDSENIITNASVQYNFMFSSLEKLDLKYSGKLIPIASLITNDYLVPQIRHMIGAYGVQLIIERRGIFMFSFRDPAVEKTFLVFEGIADYIEKNVFKQDTIDRYIIRSFSALTKSEGVLHTAISAMQDKYLGYPKGYRSDLLTEVKNTTVEDVKALSPYFRKLNESAVRSTAGGQYMPQIHGNLFKRIIRVYD